MKRFFTGNTIIALIGVVFFIGLAVALKRSLPLPPKPKVLVTFRGGIHDVIIEPNGSLIVCGDYSGETSGKHPVAFISATGAITLAEPALPIGALKKINFSPDGKRLAGPSQWGLWIADLSGHQLGRQVTSSQAFYARSGDLNIWKYPVNGKPFWRNDGTITSISSGDFDLGPVTITRFRQSDAASLGQKILIPVIKDDRNFSGFALSSDGGTAAIVRNGVRRTAKSTEMLSRGSIELWDVDKVRRLRDLEPIRPRGLGKLVFSSDGKFLAAADGTGSGFVWETSNGALVQMISGLRHRVSMSRGFSGSFSDQMFSETATLAFAPDNRTIFAGLNDGTILSYDRQSGLPIAVLARMGKPLYKLNCSPDGSRLTFIARDNTGSTLFALEVSPSSLAPH